MPTPPTIDIIAPPSPPAVDITPPECPEIDVKTSVGLPGPPGPPGPPGTGGGSYHFYQTVAATIWTVVHNLDFVPNITVVDSTKQEIYPEISYTNPTTITLHFSAAVAGEAYLS